MVMGDEMLVIFDCDGVLVDSERLVQDVDMAMIAELGWSITREEILEQHLGRSEEAVIENIERRLGQSVPDGFAERRGAAYMEAFNRHLTEMPGVRAVVEAQGAAGRDFCVASSGSHERMAFTLGRTGLLSLFAGRIFSAEEVEHSKPEPDLFLHAAQQRGVPPGRCVVVEDSPSGVAAARMARMRVIGFCALTPARALADADELVSEMAEMSYAIARQAARLA